MDFIGRMLVIFQHFYNVPLPSLYPPPNIYHRLVHQTCSMGSHLPNLFTSANSYFRCIKKMKTDEQPEFLVIGLSKSQSEYKQGETRGTGCLAKIVVLQSTAGHITAPVKCWRVKAGKILVKKNTIFPEHPVYVDVFIF